MKILVSLEKATAEEKEQGVIDPSPEFFGVIQRALNFEEKKPEEWKLNISADSVAWAVVQHGQYKEAKIGNVPDFMVEPLIKALKKVGISAKK